jgi:hypothetical protein
VRSAVLIVALAGCGGASSVIEHVPPELGRSVVAVPEAPDRWSGPVQGLRPGLWVRYAEAGVQTTLQVVGTDGDSFWIESIVEGEPRAASARLVGPDGAVRKAFYAEVGKDGASRAVVQPLAQAPAPPAPRGSEVSRDVGEEKVKVGARELAAARVRVVREDLEGRRFEETSLWHRDVPPLREGGPQGGLVRRAGVELVDFGDGAKAVVSR